MWHIDNTGFTVRLPANGLEGVVNLRKDAEKFSFDKATATLSSSSRAFRVGTPVRVTLAGVDPDTPHLAQFQLDETSGLKAPPAQESPAQASAEPGTPAA